MKKHQNSEVTPIPMCKITPNSIICYTDIDGYTPNRDRKIWLDGDNYIIASTRPEALKNNSTHGYLSDKATSRLKRAIKYLYWLSGVFTIKSTSIQAKAYKKISMLTLSLSSPQVHTDNYIKSTMLNQFLIEMKNYNKNLIYFWRAEKQLNGNIHFHILLNIYLPLELVQRTWNRIQDKEGYLQPYTDKFKNITFNDYLKILPPKNHKDIEQKRKSFIQGQLTGWTQPNSIDLHSLKNVKSAYMYASKYTAKSIDDQLNYHIEKGHITEDQREEYYKKLKIQGRIWYASKAIQKCNAPAHMIENKIDEELNKLSKLPDILIKSFDYVQVFCISAENLFRHGLHHLFNLFIKQIPNSNILQTLNI